MNKREITIPMRSLAGKTLNLGYVGENLHTRIIIDCTEELCDYPNATINMAIRSPHGEIYPVLPEKDGWRAIWDVTGSDLVYAGSGQIQVTLMDGEEIIKSAVGSFTASASLETTGPAPEPLQNWMDAAEQTAAQIAEDAAEGVVDDLADAKDEAIAAIEAKGEEVIEEIPADYTQLSEDVSNVKSAIEDIDYGDWGHAFGHMNWLTWDDSKDVFIDKEYIYGYSDSNGTPAVSATISMTKLIKVNPSTSYCVSKMDNTSALLQRATFYTAAKAFDSTVYGSGISKNASNIQYITVPATAAFVRLMFAISDYGSNFNNIKVQKGTEAVGIGTPTAPGFINPQYANIGLSAYYRDMFINRAWVNSDYEANTKRLSFRYPQYTSKKVIISCNSGYKINVARYTKNSQNSYTIVSGSGTGWVSKPVTVDAANYFCVTVRKDPDGSTIVPSDGANVFFAYDNGTDFVVDDLYKRIKAVGMNAYFRRLFENCSWTSTGKASTTTRLGFKELQTTTEEIVMYADDGYEISVCYYDSEGTFISSSGWKKNSWTVTANSRYAILLRKSNDATITISDVTALHFMYDEDDKLNKLIELVEANEAGLQNQITKATKLPGEYYPKVNYPSDSPKPLKLLVFADIHNDSTRLGRIVDYLSTADVDDAMVLGDVVEGYYSDGIEFWHQANADNIMIVIGDHDVKDYDAQDIYDYDNVTQAKVYETFIEPFVSNWDVTSTEDHTYYYKDYDDSGIRLICLDSGLRDIQAKSVTDYTEQLAWLETVLADALTNELTVVVACHWPIAYRTLINCSFSAVTHDPNQSDSENQNYFLRPTYMDKVQEFINNGGKFACYLTGHTHIDKVYYYRKYPNQYAFTTSCASAESWVHATMYWDDLDRTGDAQDLFNIVTVDTNTHTFKIQRIGADRDIFGRGRHYTCIDYTDGTVVASE